MNPEIHDNASKKPVSESELEAATNATFDSFTQSARNLYKNVRKLGENLDDHATIIMTDIFGPNVAHEHSRRLEQEVNREAAASHSQAADHYKRRDLNFSRATLGEFDPYTVALNKKLNVDPIEEGLKLVEQISANSRRNKELMDELYGHNGINGNSGINGDSGKYADKGINGNNGKKSDCTTATTETLNQQQSRPSLSINHDTLSQFGTLQLQ